MAKRTRKAGTSKRATKSRKAAAARKPGRPPARGRARGSGLSALNIPAPEPINISPPEVSKKREDLAVLNVMEGARPEAQTIIYVHGIGNKPVASILKCQWDHALFGVDLGDRSRMAYWVNRDFYPRPDGRHLRRFRSGQCRRRRGNHPHDHGPLQGRRRERGRSG